MDVVIFGHSQGQGDRYLVPICLRFIISFKRRFFKTYNEMDRPTS